MDPCDELTDDDIRMAIQNATGPKSALFVPEVGVNDFLGLIFQFCNLRKSLSFVSFFLFILYIVIFPFLCANVGAI